MKPFKVIIDVTDGDLNSITSDHPVELITLDYSNEAVDASIKENNDNFIPYEVDQVSEDTVDTAGVFNSYTGEVNKEYVDSIYAYTEDQDRVVNYSTIVKNLWDDVNEDSEEDSENVEQD